MHCGEKVFVAICLMLNYIFPGLYYNTICVIMGANGERGLLCERQVFVSLLVNINKMSYL